MQIRSFTLLVFASAWLTGCSQGATLGPGGSGTSALSKLVPAEQLESSASQQYKQLLGEAQNSGALARDSDTQLQRLRVIANRIVPHAARYNERASAWQWETNLIRVANINAFCMPGGKIAFYSGLLDKLNLTDDEVGVIMGHEIAHALREHARAQIAKNTLTNVGAEAATTFTGSSTGSMIKTGAKLLSLKYSRDDETDADLVGLELAARAGFDPRSGVTLWQKMTAAARGATLEWFSTHPSGLTRIATIQKQLPKVMSLYQQAKR